MQGQQHTSDIRTGVLVKVSKFSRQKSLDLRGSRTPSLRIHAKCSYHLSYQGQTFAVPCFWTLALVVQIFWSKVKFEMLAVLGQTHSFSTHERVFLWKCQNVWDRKCLDLRGTRSPTLGFMLNVPHTRTRTRTHTRTHTHTPNTNTHKQTNTPNKHPPTHTHTCVCWHYHAWPSIRLIACPRHHCRAT